MLYGELSNWEVKLMPLATFKELSGGGLEERSEPLVNKQ
jgi:hypothetical protein